AHRRELVETYSPLLRRVARRIFRRLPPGADGVEEEDLISAGVLGLFEADLKFDPQAGYAFDAFAEFRVKGAMLDELRRRDFFPRRLRLKANKLRKATECLEQRHGRDPTDDELAKELLLTSAELVKLRDDCAPYRYVDSQDAALSLEAKTPTPHTVVETRATYDHLASCIKQLPEREQYVLDMYYNHELTLREIAEALELTVGRISQIKTAAVGRLRTLMEPS
ncbi:MAG: RNA polymerase sigma factor for flagellar operon FliA, partial [Flavobacteriales bacterium]